MTGTNTTEAAALWAGIDDQRARTARMLEGLSAEQWDRPSLCEGWTVRHVAAHLTMQQVRPREAVGFLARHPRMLRATSLNAFIHDAAVLRAGDLSQSQVIDGIRSGTGSRRHNPFVTPLETLTDILVHSQDIALPLGLHLAMRPGASSLAATRRWDTRNTWLSRVNRRIPLEKYRLRATDTDWTRGEGPDVAGPIGAILLLLTGRTVALQQLTGEGSEQVRESVDAYQRPGLPPP